MPLQNTFFEIHIDESCAHNQVKLVPVMFHGGYINEPIIAQLTKQSFDRLMDLPKQEFNDNTLIKICTNI